MRRLSNGQCGTIALLAMAEGSYARCLKVSFRFKGVVSEKEILMIGTPEITETRPWAAAVIHVTVSDHHLKTSEQAFDFEVGFPIEDSAPGTRRCWA